jgi:hypothetical protein
MKLSSGLKREIAGHFALDEDGLRRIVGVLEAKAATLPHRWAIVLVVHREDDRFYETVKLTDVLSDPNAEGHSIRKLSIELRADDPSVTVQPWERTWIVQIAYNSEKTEKKGSIQINVNSEDRTWALLLADEIEPQVRRTISNEKISTLILALFFISVGAFAAAATKSLGPHLGFSSEVIDNVVAAAWCIAFLAAFFAIDDRPFWMAHFAGPQSAFSWGERAKSFQASVERQKNFFLGSYCWFASFYCFFNLHEHRCSWPICFRIKKIKYLFPKSLAVRYAKHML